MESRIGSLLAGLVLGGSYAIGGAAVVRAALNALAYLAARGETIHSSPIT